jgi:hypothetical protein
VAAELWACAKRWKQNPSWRKENPTLTEGKSKQKEGKSKLVSPANRAFSKGCGGPEAISSSFAVSGQITS